VNGNGNGNMHSNLYVVVGNILLVLVTLLLFFHPQNLPRAPNQVLHWTTTNAEINELMLSEIEQLVAVQDLGLLERTLVPQKSHGWHLPIEIYQ
jgi:hypothetical protein